jgi:hypothetical protein
VKRTVQTWLLVSAAARNELSEMALAFEKMREAPETVENVPFGVLTRTVLESKETLISQKGLRTEGVSPNRG